MEILEQITMVFFVLALLGGMLWIFRSKGMATIRIPRKGGGSTRQLEVVERLPLTPNHSVHLIRMGSRTLLIGVAPGGCTLLEKSDDSAAPVFRKPPYFEAQ